ncbi:MAG: DUF1080 domain-containing protein [Halieaceae bacterium]
MTAFLLLALSLFNGSSLSGWLIQGEAQWSVQDGEIVALGDGDGFLATEALYADFHLRAEFWVDASTNSGIFIRCQDRLRIHPETCYELNIWDEHPQQQARTGAIVFRAMPPLTHVNTVGRWNQYDVLAQGSHIEVRVNGELTAKLDDAKPDAGFIALQHWQSGQVRFRNLTLMPLEK